jgi:glucan 1,3-beta-glucosidase
MSECVKCALDTHVYQAWAWDSGHEWFIEHACGDGGKIKEFENSGINIIVGEWSLATDNCAMWLNGFNDNGK